VLKDVFWEFAPHVANFQMISAIDTAVETSQKPVFFDPTYILIRVVCKPVLYGCET
jgi:hypothetical protein